MHTQIASSLYCCWAYRIHDQADTSVVFRNCTIIPKSYWNQEKSGVAFTLYIKTVHFSFLIIYSASPDHYTIHDQNKNLKACSCPNKTFKILKSYVSSFWIKTQKKRQFPETENPSKTRYYTKFYIFFYKRAISSNEEKF